MKKIVLIAFMILRVIIGYSQDYLYLGFGGALFDFEDSTEYNNVLMDTNNVWQITQPQKDILYLPNLPFIYGEYGIITGANQYYQMGETSSFQFKLLLLSGTDIYNISFWHKYDFNPNIDGGIIETSWNYGTSWQNIIFDSILQTNLVNGVSENMYHLTDTIRAFDNQPGFTGLQDAGTTVNIDFSASERNLNDTLLLRFTFKSDSLAGSHEGWLLDNFSFSGTVVDGIEQINHVKKLRILSNFAREQIILKLENEVISYVQLYTMTGVKTLECHDSSTIDMRGLASGIYILIVNNRYAEKLIVE